MPIPCTITCKKIRNFKFCSNNHYPLFYFLETTYWDKIRSNISSESSLFMRAACKFWWLFASFVCCLVRSFLTVVMAVWQQLKQSAAEGMLGYGTLNPRLVACHRATWILLQQSFSLVQQHQRPWICWSTWMCALSQLGHTWDFRSFTWFQLFLRLL